MTGTVAEVRVGDLPKPVRSKLGLDDRGNDELVKVTTVDELTDKASKQVATVADADAVRAARVVAVKKAIGRTLPRAVQSVVDIVREGRDERDKRATRLSSGKKS